MRKKFSLIALSALTALVFASFGGKAMAEDVVMAKPSLTFNGIAYIAGHGGHLAIIDLRTMRPPTDADTDRIVLTEAGSEMEGVIAGMNFEQVKKAGGSHGQAMVKESGQKYLIAGTLNGDAYRVNLATGEKEGPIKVGLTRRALSVSSNPATERSLGTSILFNCAQRMAPIAIISLAPITAVQPCCLRSTAISLKPISRLQSP